MAKNPLAAKTGGKTARSSESSTFDYRGALDIAEEMGELVRVKKEVDPLIGIPAILKACGRLKPIPAMLFENVRGYPGARVVGNLFSEQQRSYRICGLNMDREIDRSTFLEALENPIDPILVDSGLCQENVIPGPVAVERYIPPTHGALMIRRSYYQPLVFIKHPKTGKPNMSIYRACIQPDGRLTTNIRWDTHGGLYLKQAIELGQPLPIAMCIGAPPAAYLAAVSKLPYGCSELGFAGAILGRPLEMVRCKTIDIEVPATAEIVIEGEIRPPYERGDDGPWPEYLTYLGAEVHPPVVDVTCLTYRNNFVEHMQIPGTAPHYLNLGNSAVFYRFLQSIFGEFVIDCNSIPRSFGHSSVIKVRKSEPFHEGLQINVALAAFGHSQVLDKVTLVDEDINIHDLAEVEWAASSRCDPATQVHILPQARTHQNNPIAGIKEVFDEPITKAKLIIDATIPWKLKHVQKTEGLTFFTRSSWPEINLAEYFEPEDHHRFLRILKDR